MHSNLPPLLSGPRKVGIEMLIVKKELSLEAEEQPPLPQSSIACKNDSSCLADIKTIEILCEMSSEVQAG